MELIYVLLLRLVAYLEGPQKIVAFIFVFGFISYSTLKIVPTAGLIKITKYNLFFLATSILILIHTLIFGHVLLRDIAVLLTFWIWFVFTYNFFKEKTLEQCLKYILISFFIFNFYNFLLFKFYFADQKFGINTILSLFGIYGYRIYFPLSSGANIYTSQLALNSIIVLYFIKKSKSKSNLLYILLYVFYFYMLVMADSRLILAFSIAFSFIFWFSLKTFVAILKKFWWIIGIIFFIFLYIFYGTDLFDSFKRAGELDGKALSRIKIWNIAKKVIFNDLHLISGYGLNGFENNMSIEASQKFEDQNLQTSHNFLIQNLIDFGIVGFLIILYLIFKILKMVQYFNSEIISILVIMLLFMGITESIPSFYSFEPTLFFIAILSIILTKYERKIN
jgi:O-antigen ligase|tara:strand:- start:423 stop:1598 length:1176 start_codon:yes stop_codon:yes gene_type:complete